MAAVVGAVVILTLIFVAKWTGDQIRMRFLTPKQVLTEVAETKKPEAVLGTDAAKGTATYSAIPATGPNDLGYALLALLALAGFSFLTIARFLLNYKKLQVVS